MQTQKIRLVAVDHNPVLREGLTLLIHLQPDIELLAAVATAGEAVQLYRESRPDMTLIDLDLADGAGIEAVERIRRINPDASVLGLMTYEWDEATRTAAVRAGACGCLAKARLGEELIPRIRKALRATSEP